MRFSVQTGIESLGYIYVEDQGGIGGGISFDGGTIVGDSGHEGMIWREESGMTSYPEGGIGEVLEVADLTPDSSTVALSAVGGRYRAVIDDGVTPLSNTPVSINSDASYVAGRHSSNGGFDNDGALWCDDLPLVIVDEISTHAEQFSDVSADGSICTFPNSTQFQYWKEGVGIVELPGLYQNSSGDNAVALSADGQVLVGTCRELGGPPFGTSAVIWTAETGTRRIKDVLISLGVNVGNFFLNEATDISADGTTICGNGSESFGFTNEGWMCHIPRTALSPYSARPNYVKPIFGSITAGDRRGTFKPDDDREEFTSGVTPTFNSAPITVEFSATQARTYGKLDFEIDIQVNKVGLQQSIDLWDWDLNNWVQVDTRAAKKDQDQLVSLSFPTGHFYVRYDGRVRARLRVKPNSPQSQPGFKAKVDYVAWKVTPP